MIRLYASKSGETNSAIRTLTEVLHAHRIRTLHADTDPIQDALAGAIDMYVNMRYNNFKQDVGREPRHFVFVGPKQQSETGEGSESIDHLVDESDGFYAFFTIKAYDMLHAKYAAAVEFTTQYQCASADSIELSYSYSIVQFLQDLVDEGANLDTAIETFQSHSLSPFYILPYDNADIDATESD